MYHGYRVQPRVMQPSPVAVALAVEVVWAVEGQVPVEVPRGDHGGPGLRHTLQAHIAIMKGAIARNRRAPLSGCRYY